jgi:hypothetical protein
MKKLLALLAVSAILLAPACRKPNPPAAPSPSGEVAAFPDPVSYDLKIDIDYESGIVAAGCSLVVRNSQAAPIPVVPLNLYRLMEVSSVTDASGNVLPYSQSVRIFEDWREFQVNHIVVRLDPPLAPGKEKELRIKYAGPLLGYSEAMRYVKDRVDKEITLIRSDSLAFPQIGVPSWRANRAAGLKNFSYTASLTVPTPLVVANGGDLVSKDVHEGRTTYVYKDRVPSWRIDLAVANYEIIEGEGGRLRIFAFPGDAAGARDLLSSLTKTLTLYTQWFGPLKTFPGLTVIEIPQGYGSQADVVAIVQEATAFKDPAGRYTFYHELSHLWGVTAKDPLPSRFESEGMAMFLQHLVQEKLEGKAGAVKEAVAASLVRLAKNFAEHPDWKKAPMVDYGEKDLTDLSYRMGQVLFYLLYDVLGEQAFMETAGSFYRDYRDTGATSRQFVEHIKKRAGRNLDKLFEEWVFTPRAAELIAAGISLDELVRRYR